MGKSLDVDVLIIGSGISGLYLALQLDPALKVLIVTKDGKKSTGTYHAQGGVASVLSQYDTLESHFADTLNAGAGLNDNEAVQVLVNEGPRHIRHLLEMGVPFEKDVSGNLLLTREGGHSADRIVYAGDHTGREILDILEVRAEERGNVELLEYHSVVELITRYHLKDSGQVREEPACCYGAYIYDRGRGEVDIVRAHYTVLATGGAGQVYLHNTNPPVSTGDGVALAYRAGAIITNMEFYQFHPTAFHSSRLEETSFLISEAVRGHGAVLRDLEGRAFMKDYDPRGDLAPRDIVARAIDAEMKKSGAAHLWLDTTHHSRQELSTRFPTIFQHCLNEGIDISKKWIPIVPAAHYMCGGVETDMDGRTCVENLFAVGEVAHTGVHGGNRLASNSLLEGLVFAARIGKRLSEEAFQRKHAEVKEWDKQGLDNIEEWVLVEHNFEALKRVMHNYVGIVRSDLRLNRALRRVNMLYDEIEDFYRRTFIKNRILELRNMTTVARLIVLSALARKESRGLHYSQDYPEDRTPSHHYTRMRRSAAEYPELLPTVQE